MVLAWINAGMRPFDAVYFAVHAHVWNWANALANTPIE